MKVKSMRPYFPEEDRESIAEEVKDVLTTGRLILGKYTKRFEEGFAKYVGTKHAVGINTCTSALTTSLRFIDVNDREVIVPSNTFIATPNSVFSAGGKPVFAEMKKETLCLDPDDIRKKITDKTKAVILVHMLGLVGPEVDEIREICEEKKITLLEDDAHAHGASYNGKKAGSFGHAGCFSFYPTKIMTTTTGGMITTNDEDLVAFAKSVRFFGSGNELSYIVRDGNDWLMGEINAILGHHQLKRLDSMIGMRNQIARVYDQELSGIENIELFPVPEKTVHSYYKYPVLLSDKFNKEDVKKRLKSEFEIETTNVYVPCHVQPFYKDAYGFKEGLLPVTEDILSRTVCLPIYAGMTAEEQKHVIESFKKVIGQ